MGTGGGISMQDGDVVLTVREQDRIPAGITLHAMPQLGAARSDVVRMGLWEKLGFMATKGMAKPKVSAENATPFDRWQGLVDEDEDTNGKIDEVTEYVDPSDTQ